MACAGDVPTLETLAAVDWLRKHIPDLKVRVVNVVDLMALQPHTEHPHGMTDEQFDALFTKDRPIVFAFHGYPWLIHRLTYRRTNHDNMHVRGYKEEGTTTTPFDMTGFERPGPVSPGGRRDRPGARPGRARGGPEAPPARQTHRAQAVRRALRRRYAGDSQLALVLSFSGERSAAHQAFQRRNHDAYDGVGQKAVVNPVPGKPDHQANVAHAAVCTAARRWNQ